MNMNLSNSDSELNINDQFQIIKIEFELESEKLLEYYDTCIVDEIKKNYLNYLNSNKKGIKKFADICFKYFDYSEQYKNYIENQIFIDNKPLEIKKYIDDKINNISDKFKPLSKFDKIIDNIIKLAKFDVKYKDFVKTRFNHDIVQYFLTYIDNFKKCRSIKNNTFLISSELSDKIHNLSTNSSISSLSNNDVICSLLIKLCQNGLNDKCIIYGQQNEDNFNVKFEIFDEQKIINELKLLMYASKNDVLSLDLSIFKNNCADSFIPDDNYVLDGINYILESILFKIDFLEKYNFDIERLKK